MIEIYNEDRPWGFFRRFTKEVSSTVKLITIKAGERLSLQYHKNREEFWHIVSGTPTVEIDGKSTNARAGDEFFVGKEIKHRISAPSDEVVFLEIAFGIFDENDVVRLEDQYGRLV